MLISINLDKKSKEVAIKIHLFLRTVRVRLKLSALTIKQWNLNDNDKQNCFFFSQEISF